MLRLVKIKLFLFTNLTSVSSENWLIKYLEQFFWCLIIMNAFMVFRTKRFLYTDSTVSGAIVLISIATSEAILACRFLKVEGSYFDLRIFT